MSNRTTLTGDDMSKKPIKNDVGSLLPADVRVSRFGTRS
jgi:hypothetical protein